MGQRNGRAVAAKTNMRKNKREHGERLHRSLDYRRVESDRATRGVTLEVAFADEWEKENQRRPGLNHGFGILQDLMFGHWDRSRVSHIQRAWYNQPWARFIISRRDAVIVATVVQWLGTNCGSAFLEDVFRRAGYRLLRPSEVEREARLRQDQRDTRSRLEAEVKRLRDVERAVLKLREELEGALTGRRDY